MTGAVALVGSLLEDSGPRRKEGTVPLVLAHPSLYLWRLRQSPAPVPLPPALRGWAGVWWGCPPSLGSLPGLGYCPQAGQPVGPWSPAASLPAPPSATRGAVATPAPGLAGGGAPSAAHIPSREAGSRPSVSS